MILRIIFKILTANYYCPCIEMFGIELNAVVNQQRTQKVRTFETEMIEQTFVIFNR
jgi:hypothetical protein